ncbi:MAG: hypothetical protein EAS48_03450 [Chryseobacterium sp.]|nr:MAG: hypothetical protein EAS48_03450 [Chryseobacterium sp.]
MKKYIFSAMAAFSLVACNVPAGGNKDVIRATTEIERYDDNIFASEQEPDFSNKTDAKVMEPVQADAAVIEQINKPAADSAQVNPAQ